MRIHEYQAKELFKGHGLPVPSGVMVDTPAAASVATRDLGGKAVLKAQVHAGGRGKAGGIKVVSSPEEAERVANEMLGTRLVTAQTVPEGVPVRRILVEETVDVTRELYLATLVDGSAGGVVIMASEAGGMDIEAVAAETSERILKVPVNSAVGYQQFQGRKLAYGLGIDPDLVRPFTALVGGIYSLLSDYDCSLVEINPLVITSDDRIVVLDAKMSFEDDSLFRHRDLTELADPEQDDPFEVQAREYSLNYVKLSGEVGCIVNGAGLAMATMDVATAAGAAPANFLDVGGAADEEKIARALTIVLSDPTVTKVFVNIFGGILRNDVVARGLLLGAESLADSLRPMVVRMLGTNAEEGRRLLTESALEVTLVDDLKQATAALKAI